MCCSSEEERDPALLEVSKYVASFVQLPHCCPLACSNCQASRAAVRSCSFAAFTEFIDAGSRLLLVSARNDMQTDTLWNPALAAVAILLCVGIIFSGCSMQGAAAISKACLDAATAMPSAARLYKGCCGCKQQRSLSRVTAALGRSFPLWDLRFG
jgi:hypothetical protein